MDIVAADLQPKEMSDLYVKAVVGRGSFGLVKLVFHKRDKWPGLVFKCERNCCKHSRVPE